MTVIYIVAKETFTSLRKTDPESGEVYTVHGEARDCFTLGDDPAFSITGGVNALNQFCRKLVEAGFSGSAVVVDDKGKSRFIIRSIEAMGRMDLRESAGTCLRYVPFVPMPAARKRTLVAA